MASAMRTLKVVEKRRGNWSRDYTKQNNKEMPKPNSNVSAHARRVPTITIAGDKTANAVSGLVPWGDAETTGLTTGVSTDVGRDDNEGAFSNSESYAPSHKAMPGQTSKHMQRLKQTHQMQQSIRKTVPVYRDMLEKRKVDMKVAHGNREKDVDTTMSLAVKGPGITGNVADDDVGGYGHDTGIDNGNDDNDNETPGLDEGIFTPVPIEKEEVVATKAPQFRVHAGGGTKRSKAGNAVRSNHMSSADRQDGSFNQDILVTLQPTHGQHNSSPEQSRSPLSIGSPKVPTVSVSMHRAPNKGNSRLVQNKSQSQNQFTSSASQINLMAETRSLNTSPIPNNGSVGLNAMAVMSSMEKISPPPQRHGHGLDNDNGTLQLGANNKQHQHRKGRHKKAVYSSPPVPTLPGRASWEACVLANKGSLAMNSGVERSEGMESPSGDFNLGFHVGTDPNTFIRKSTTVTLKGDFGGTDWRGAVLPTASNKDTGLVKGKTSKQQQQQQQPTHMESGTSPVPSDALAMEPYLAQLMSQNQPHHSHRHGGGDSNDAMFEVILSSNPDAGSGRGHGTHGSGSHRRAGSHGHPDRHSPTRVSPTPRSNRLCPNPADNLPDFDHRPVEGLSSYHSSPIHESPTPDVTTGDGSDSKSKLNASFQPVRKARLHPNPLSPQHAKTDEMMPLHEGHKSHTSGVSKGLGVEPGPIMVPSLSAMLPAHKLGPHTQQVGPSSTIHHESKLPVKPKPKVGAAMVVDADSGPKFAGIRLSHNDAREQVRAAKRAVTLAASSLEKQRGNARAGRRGGAGAQGAGENDNGADAREDGGDTVNRPDAEERAPQYGLGDCDGDGDAAGVLSSIDWGDASSSDDDCMVKEEEGDDNDDEHYIDYAAEYMDTMEKKIEEASKRQHRKVDKVRGQKRADTDNDGDRGSYYDGCDTVEDRATPPWPLSTSALRIGHRPLDAQALPVLARPQRAPAASVATSKATPYRGDVKKRAAAPRTNVDHKHPTSGDGAVSAGHGPEMRYWNQFQRQLGLMEHVRKKRVHVQQHKMARQPRQLGSMSSMPHIGNGNGNGNGREGGKGGGGRKANVAASSLGKGLGCWGWGYAEDTNLAVHQVVALPNDHGNGRERSDGGDGIAEDRWRAARRYETKTDAITSQSSHQPSPWDHGAVLPMVGSGGTSGHDSSLYDTSPLGGQTQDAYMSMIKPAVKHHQTPHDFGNEPLQVFEAPSMHNHDALHHGDASEWEDVAATNFATNY